MAFVNERKEKLNGRDVAAVKEMLTNLLNEQKDFIDRYPKIMQISLDKDFCEKMKGVFQNALNGLSDKMKQIQNQKENMDIDTFISGLYDGIWNDLFKDIAKEGQPDYFNFLYLAYHFHAGKFSALYKDQAKKDAIVARCMEHTARERRNEGKPPVQDPEIRRLLAQRDVSEIPLVCGIGARITPDTQENYNALIDSFQLTDQSMEGIHDIKADLNSADIDDDAFLKLRMGNSKTLDNKRVEQLQKEWSPESIKREKEGQQYYADPRYRICIDAVEENLTPIKVDGQDMLPHQVAQVDFKKATEMVSQCANQLKQQENVTFSDLYHALMDINKTLRHNDVSAGKLSAQRRACDSADGSEDNAIEGVGSFVSPIIFRKTLSKIAYYMNQIKTETNPDLKKTNAMRLAAYAYKVFVSAHAFDDGSGRTSRLFADIILQFAGLLPHTPLKEETQIGCTIGSQKDKESSIDQIAQIFLQGVKKSSETLAAQKNSNPSVVKKSNDALVAQFKQKADMWNEIEKQIHKLQKSSQQTQDVRKPYFYKILEKTSKLAQKIYQSLQKNEDVTAEKKRYDSTVQNLRKDASAFLEYMNQVKAYRENGQISFKASQEMQEQAKQQAKKRKDDNIPLWDDGEKKKIEIAQVILKACPEPKPTAKVGFSSGTNMQKENMKL